MPVQSLFTTTTTLPSPIDAHSIDAKARTEYERDRQKAHKYHDIRKKHQLHQVNHPKAAHPRHHLGSGHWRNLVVDMEEDLSSPVQRREPDDCQEVYGKENSPVTASFQDFVRAAPPASPKPRQARSPRSLYSSNDLTAALTRASLSPPTTAPTPPQPLPDLESPMISLSPYRSSSLQLPDDDFDWNEFSSPGADEWMMKETEDGCLSFICTTAAPETPTSPVATFAPSIILVEKSDW